MTSTLSIVRYDTSHRVVLAFGWLALIVDVDLLVSAVVHEFIATEEEEDKSMAIGSKRPLRDSERVKTGNK